jgi:hypothetical protein
MLPRFVEAIRSLPAEPLTLETMTERFTLYVDGRVRIIYAPFGSVNRTARVAIVGITPGLHQAQVAFESVREALVRGDDLGTAISNAKSTASFAGPMRKNLVTMLDALGLPKLLSIPTTASLFDEAQYLLHSTSAIRYPAFVDGENYTGHNPGILKHPHLLEYVETVLADELDAVSDALIVPLGGAVDQVVKWLVSRGRLDKCRCLVGFPHPSGGNGHRVRQFHERRTELTVAIDEWFKTY